MAKKNKKHCELCNKEIIHRTYIKLAKYCKQCVKEAEKEYNRNYWKRYYAIRQYFIFSVAFSDVDEDIGEVEYDSREFVAIRPEEDSESSKGRAKRRSRNRS